MLKNSRSAYGWVAIVLHWVIALTVIGQFSIGLYMVSLNYHSPLYHTLPDYHKAVGILLAAVLVFRALWMVLNHRPQAASGVAPWEHKISRVVQWLMNLLLFVVVVMGYLMSTAAGDSIDVFGLFEIPASVTSIEQQEDWAGNLHYWFALSVIALATLHGLAALKHHFLDKDRTLKRMFGIKET